MTNQWRGFVWPFIDCHQFLLVIDGLIGIDWLQYENMRWRKQTCLSSFTPVSPALKYFCVVPKGAQAQIEGGQAAHVPTDTN